MFLRHKTQNSDGDLIKGCLEGRESAYKALYEKYYGKMLNVCRRYSRDEDEAKDMLQEGFVRMFKHLTQFQGSGSFEGWLRRVMVTTSINYLKRFHPGNTVEYSENLNSDMGDEMDEPVDSDSIDPSVIQDTGSGELLEMIQLLPPVYKVVFNLYAIEGYSHKEIGEMLDITESTSRSNLSKARVKLKAMLEGIPNGKIKLASGK